jgi:hypothetical protein
VDEEDIVWAFDMSDVHSAKAEVYTKGDCTMFFKSRKCSPSLMVDPPR